MVNCEKCRNYETEKCEECEHFERDLYDYFEPISEEELQAMEEENRKKQLAACILATESVDILPTMLNRLLEFTDRKHFRFPAVYCGKNVLVATDGVTVIRFREEVPDQLVDKYILGIDSETGTVTLAKPYPNVIQKCNEIINEIINDCKNNYKRLEIKYDEIINEVSSEQGYVQVYETSELTFAETTIAFDKARLLKALSLFKSIEEDVINVYWPAEPYQTVLFKGSNAEIIIMPVRTRS